MEIFDPARLKMLNETILLKVLITHEETLRNSCLDYLKNLYPAEQLSEDNMFTFIDNKITTSSKEFNKTVNSFLRGEGVLKGSIYSIGYNRRILSDLNTFSLNQKLASGMVGKAKAPTISNTDFISNLSIENIFAQKQSFNASMFDALEKFKEPSYIKDIDGIEVMYNSPIKRHEELNGNEVVNGTIELKFVGENKLPVITYNEFNLIERDENKEITSIKRLDFKNSLANKENLIDSIHSELSGMYITNLAINGKKFPIKGKCLLISKIDYSKVEKYTKNPESIPSYEYEIDKNGIIKISLDENFILEFQEHFVDGLQNKYTLEYGNAKKKFDYNDVFIHAGDAFSENKMVETVKALVKFNEKGVNLLKDYFLLKNKMVELGVEDFDTQVEIVQVALIKYLDNKKDLLNKALTTEEYVDLGYLTPDDVSCQIRIIKDSILSLESSLKNCGVNYKDYELLKNAELEDLVGDYLDRFLDMKPIEELKSIQIELAKIQRTCELTTLSKIDYAFNKIFEYSYNSNNGSLKNDRTHQRRVLENISKVSKEIGISTEELVKHYLKDRVKMCEENVKKLELITSGFSENLDFQNQKELPIIDINNLPKKSLESQRVISYDLETGGLNAAVDGLSQFTAMVVDYDKDGKVEKRFFVDEYVNPEMNPLPVIGRNDDGYIFGDNGKPPEGTEVVIYGYNSDGDMLTNDTYHIWKTNNPHEEMFDKNGDKIMYLYPQQNIGAIHTHGISNEQLVEKPTFREIVNGVSELMKSSDFIMGFNTEKFDNNFLLGLAKKNEVVFNIENSKNVDLKRFTGDLFTYSQVKNGVFSTYKNANKLELENNERFAGKTLNALCMMTLTSLGARYVTGEEVHDAKADTLITGNLGRNTFEISKKLLKELKSIQNDVNLNFKDLNLSIKDGEKSKDGELLYALKVFLKIEEKTNEIINNVAWERQLDLLDPTLKTVALNALNVDQKNELLEKDVVKQNTKKNPKQSNQQMDII